MDTTFDINKIDEIISGNDLEQEKFYSESYASTSFLMDDKLSDLDKFKKYLKKFINTEKNYNIEPKLIAKPNSIQ